MVVLYELLLSSKNLGKPLDCDEGGDIIRIEMLGKLNHYLARVSIFLITAALIVGMAGCDGTPAVEIRTWYDLDAVRDNLGGSYVLMNDLDSTTAGYDELASPTANGGEGWQPIGPEDNGFTGTFDGQGYQIRDLCINHPDEMYVGLFGVVGEGGVVQNTGVVNANVTGGLVGCLVGINFGTVSNCYSTGNIAGYMYVGGLVGVNDGTVSNSYSTGNVAGNVVVGGLVGLNGYTAPGTVNNSYSTGDVTGESSLGGLVGVNGYFAPATVSNSYSTGDVTGGSGVGGLVGMNGAPGPGGGVNGTVSNSYSTGSVAGEHAVGGLVGFHYYGTVSNSYYNCDVVLINGENVITIGALLNGDFDQWLANDKFLDVNDRLHEEDGCYVVASVADFKQLLAFGQDVTLKFRLTDDLDLAAEPDFYIPYLGGQFDGDGHRISNLNLNLEFVFNIGLFGYLAPGGNVIGLAAEDVSITGEMNVGGLVGRSGGAVADSSSTGSVVGLRWVGGLVASNHGTVSNSYFTGTATGGSSVGGLTGENSGTVSNCHSDGSVAGENYVGGLTGQSSGTVSSSYSNGNVSGDYSVGGLEGENGGTVSNSYSSSNVSGDYSVGGLLGGNTGTVRDSYFTGSVAGNLSVGGLVGQNYHAIVSNSYYDYDEVLINGENVITRGALFHQDFEQWLADGKFLDVNDRLSQESGYYVISDVNDFKQLLAFGQNATLNFRLKNDLDLATEPNFYIPYLAGEFDGNGYKISNWSFNFDFISQVGLFGRLAPGAEVTHVGVENVNIASCMYVGGLVGYSRGTVSNSYSTGSVTGSSYVGGLVGYVWEGSVSDSYSTSSVTGSMGYVGGLVGEIWVGTVSDSYSSGNVAGNYSVGGLVGYNAHGTVSNSFWDTQTSGQATSDGGTGKNTTQMQDIATFSDAGWDIVLIGDYVDETWYIDDGNDYPRLGWQY